MSGDAERAFRAAERLLDELLGRDEAAIRDRGVAISDWSGRAYHYKNDLLTWSFHFEARKQRGSEVQTVGVFVSLTELNTTELNVRTRAELFQIGKESRWELRTEQQIPLAQAAEVGLAAIVLNAISAGETAADENV